MGGPQLTTKQVKSHLQKYRMRWVMGRTGSLFCWPWLGGLGHGNDLSGNRLVT